jgi:hypothetical protein
MALTKVLERDWAGYTTSGLGQWMAWAETLALEDALAAVDAVIIARLARKRLIVRGTLA